MIEQLLYVSILVGFLLVEIMKRTDSFSSAISPASLMRCAVIASSPGALPCFMSFNVFFISLRQVFLALYWLNICPYHGEFYKSFFVILLHF